MIDLDGSIKGEADLITRYRQMSQHSEVQAAIDEIINEAIVVEEEEPTVKIDLDALGEEGVPDPLLDVIRIEFEEVLRLLEFNTSAYDVFRKWYVDGRLYYHIIIDREAPQAGIKELRYIDPRKIRKVREVTRKRASNDVTPVTVQRVTAEYYVYNEAGFDGKQTQQQGQVGTNVGVRIARDAVVLATSGILDDRGQMVLGHLHQAVRPLNMLRTMEDSAVIYRLVRAPERRVWYIDVGTLPKHKAEQVIYDMMTRHKNKLVYDPGSGQIRDHRKHITMLEDIWLSRREGNRGTQVETLPGSQNLDALPEIEYFLRKLYKSLNVPITRLMPEVMYSLGRENEITRSEVNFSKFIDRIRNRFCELFLDLLERQLILKGFVSPEEWDEVRAKIKFLWARDNYFAELKEQEILNQRVATLNAAMPIVGRYVSNRWVRAKILHQTDEEMKEMDEEILEEMQNPIYMVPTDDEGNPVDVGPGLSLPK